MPSAARQEYSAAHRRRARELKAAMHDGDPCARCGLPMYRAELASIHADHVDEHHVDGGELPDALSHARCNTSHGARLGNARRAGRRSPPPTPRAELPVW